MSELCHHEKLGYCSDCETDKIEAERDDLQKRLADLGVLCGIFFLLTCINEKLAKIAKHLERKSND